MAQTQNETTTQPVPPLEMELELEHDNCSVSRADNSKNHNQHSLGCGIMGRHPVLSIITFAILGIILGVGLSYWRPTDAAGINGKETALMWIGLIGDMFIRALTCVVLPLIFVDMIISIVDMLSVGKASAIGAKVVVFYLITTLCAAIIGVTMSKIYSPLFKSKDVGDVSEYPVMISLGCNNPGFYFMEGSDGQVTCSSSYSNVSDIQFQVNQTGLYKANDPTGLVNDLSMSDTLYQGLFQKIITNNIFLALTESNFAAVIFFGIFFGVAFCKEMSLGTVHSSTLTLLHELDKVFVRMISWLIMLTPFAVFSLIATAIGGQSDFMSEFANVGWLVLAILSGYICQYVIVYIGIPWIITGKNPLGYLKFIMPAQTMAMACASSAATLPITMECVQESERVPEPVWRFILPLGATINMDGAAIYICCAVIWLAYLNGITPNVADYILLVILSTVGSAGAAPVPASTIVMILTSYNTIFNQTGTPDGIEFIMAADWLIDRFSTAMNVTSDSVVSLCVACSTNLDNIFDVEKDTKLSFTSSKVGVSINDEK